MKISRLYSNENFPLDIVKILRFFGHDVLTSLEAGQAHQGIPDDAVLKFAHQQERIVITLNRKDFIKLHRQSNVHSGIIVCKDDRDYEGQAGKVNDLILAEKDLRSRLFRVNRNNNLVFTYQEEINSFRKGTN